MSRAWWQWHLDEGWAVSGAGPPPLLHTETPALKAAGGRPQGGTLQSIGHSTARRTAAQHLSAGKLVMVVMVAALLVAVWWQQHSTAQLDQCSVWRMAQHGATWPKPHVERSTAGHEAHSTAHR